MYVNDFLLKKYGLEQSVLLQNFYFWINHNSKKKINYIDGKFWTFSTLNQLLKRYPFLTIHKIRTAIDSLIKLGIIIKDNHNFNRYNRTTWYAFKDYAIFNEIKNIYLEEARINEAKRNQQLNEVLDIIGVSEEEKKEDSPTEDKTQEKETKVENTVIEDIQSKAEIIANEKQTDFQQEQAKEQPEKSQIPQENNNSICGGNKSCNKINEFNNIKLSFDISSTTNKPIDNPKLPVEQRKALISELLKRDITKFQVYSIIANYEYSYILTKIKQFDFVVSHFPERMKNRGRYMFMSIKDNWIDEVYEKTQLAKIRGQQEDKAREDAKKLEKLKQDYEFYLDDECKKEYLTLSDEEKELADREIKQELDNSAFIKSNELLYLASLEAKRVLFVMSRVKSKALSFQDFVKNQSTK